MLRRSWSLFVAASNDAPSLVPPDLWTRVRQITSSPPYFTWLRGRPSRDLAHELVMGPSMATRFAGRVGAPPTVASPRRAKLAFRGRAVVGEGVGFAIDAARLLGAAGPEDELGSVEEVFPRRAARRRRFDPEIRKQMSLEHDIPRSVLDRAFRER